MNTHQQEHELVEVDSNERLATRVHSWLLIMCLGYPLLLVVLFMFGPWLAVEYVFSGLCVFIGTAYPLAMVIVLACIKQQGKVSVPWILILGPAMWIAGLSWFFIWMIGELVASC